jgi:hypothetical protein
MWPRPLRVFGRQSSQRSRNDFVRSIGPVRRRSNPSTWISEGFYVDARRGVCVASTKSSPLAGAATGIKPVFRRFYNDGTVGRLEIGFAYSQPRGRSTTFNSRRDLVNAVMSVSAWLRGNSDSAEALIYFGPIFAQRLLSATTRRAQSEGPLRHTIPKWWIMAGDPAVIVEDLSLKLRRQVITHHWWQMVADIQVSVWAIEKPAVNRADQLRRARIYLSHLHSDLATLELALSLSTAGRLDGSQTGLRNYLDIACSRLLRERRDGLLQQDYLAEVLGTMRVSYADKIAALRELSEEIESKGLSRKVQDVALLFERCAEETGRTEIIVGDSYKTEVYAGNVAGVNVGSGSVETGNIVQASVSAGEDLTALSGRIAALAAGMRGQIPDDDADAVEDTAEALRREIETGSPDKEKIQRRVDKLLSIAARAGAAGTALAGAVTAIRAAIGL